LHEPQEQDAGSAGEQGGNQLLSPVGPDARKGERAAKLRIPPIALGRAQQVRSQSGGITLSHGDIE
jgi:hypothetical protein